MISKRLLNTGREETDMSSDRIFTKNFWMVFGSLFSSAIVMYTLMSVITEYASSLGTTTTLAGLVSGIYIFGGLCSRLYSGRALETVGWKRMALVFVSLHAAACFFYFFVHNIGLLILVRFIHGIGFGAASNALMTMGMSVLPQKRFSEGCGYLMLSTTLGVGIGPFFGGMIYDRFGAFGCFTASTVLCLLMLLFLFFIDVRDMDPGVQRKKKEAIQAVFTEAGGTSPSSVNKESLNQNVMSAEPSESVSGNPDPAAADGSDTGIEESSSGFSLVQFLERFIEIPSVPISLVTGLSALGYVSVMSFSRLYASQTDLEKAFSVFFLLYAFILVFSRPMAGKLQDKIGDHIVCVPGILAQTGGLLLIAVRPCLLTVLLCALGCALGFGTLNSACNAIACRHTGNERRSYAVSTFYICCDLGMGIGPMIMGSIVSLSGSYAVMYLCASAFTLAALPLCLYALSGRKQA